MVICLVNDLEQWLDELNKYRDCLNLFWSQLMTFIIVFKRGQKGKQLIEVLERFPIGGFHKVEVTLF